MKTSISGVQRRFRHLVPHQVYINCRKHKLALCIKHLMKISQSYKSSPVSYLGYGNYFTILQRYKQSFRKYKKHTIRKKIKFIRAAATRWTSHGHACDRLLGRYSIILDTLDAIYKAKKK